MTTTEPRRTVSARILALAVTAGLVVWVGLAAACNPLDPDKIEQDDAGAATAPCQPACTSAQYCLQDTTGVCGCYDACDDALCAGSGGSCVNDPSQGGVCVDLTQIVCK